MPYPPTLHCSILTGSIVKVNRAWRDFAIPGGLSGKAFESGLDYLSACKDADDVDAELASDVAGNLRAIVSGTTTPYSIEYSCGAPGQPRWFQLLASPMPRDSGYGAVVMHVDIGERKQAEALTEEIKKRLETLVNEATVGIMVHQDWKLIMANDELARIFGYRGKEDLLALPDLRALFAPQERAQVAYYEARRNGGSVPAHYEARGKKQDGTSIDLENHAFALDWGGQGVVCAMMHECRSSSAPRQLRQSQKMEAVGQLTGGIAHDFNNILMVILANADALLEEASLAATMRASRSSRSAQAAERAADLTRSLLAFSRQQPLEPQRIDINELVVRHRRAAAPDARRADRDRARCSPTDLWTVNVDAAQLENALLNLCLNARDAMPAGGRLTDRDRQRELDDDVRGGNADRGRRRTT